MMGNALRVLLFFVFLLIFFSVFAYAAGTSTGSQTPPVGIISISPSIGMFGEAITITGYGFTSTGNAIYFDNNRLWGIFNSADGKILNFTYYGVPCQEPFSCDHLAPY
jgi:hypothetical protein